MSEFDEKVIEAGQNTLNEQMHGVDPNVFLENMPDNLRNDIQKKFLEAGLRIAVINERKRQLGKDTAALFSIIVDQLLDEAVKYNTESVRALSQDKYIGTSFDFKSSSDTNQSIDTFIKRANAAALNSDKTPRYLTCTYTDDNASRTLDVDTIALEQLCGAYGILVTPMKQPEPRISFSILYSKLIARINHEKQQQENQQYETDTGEKTGGSGYTA